MTLMFHKSISLLFSAISDLESYLMFAQGMSLMQVPLTPQDTKKVGNLTLMVPGKQTSLYT
jgi:hypothetical protein